MTALGQLQSECIKVVKDSTNPHYKSKYASLSNILDIIQPVLTKHNFAYTQLPEAGKLTTLLMHTISGEFIQTEYDLNAMQNTPQGIGSAITYARRYSLTATLGLNIDEDDDGNAASTPQKAKTTPAASAPSTQQKPPAAPQTAYNKTYNDAEVIRAVLATTSNKKEVVELYNHNKNVVDLNAGLKNDFKTRQEFHDKGNGSQGTTTQQPAPSTSQPPADLPKTLINDKQFKALLARIAKGELAVYQQALNVFKLSDSQIQEIKNLHDHVSGVEQRITNKLTDVEIAALLNDCTYAGQVMKMHQNNAMILDRDPNLMKLANERIRVLNAQNGVAA